MVEGQRLTQATSDIFLGWLSAEGPDGKSRASTSGSSGIAAFAQLHADQNERDYAAVTSAVKDGRLVAQDEPDT